MTIDYFKLNEASEEEQLEAVKNSGSAIYYIKNASERVQIEAVKNYGFAIRYIKNPSVNVQLEAVKKNGFAIDCIKNPFVDVLLFVCSQTNDLKLKGYCVKLLKETKKEKNS